MPVRNARTRAERETLPAASVSEALAAIPESVDHPLVPVVVNALDDLKAKDISVLDVRGRTSVTDFMVIASGTSNRHIKSLADNVVDEIKTAGERPLGVEGGGTSDWVLVDLGDIVVHVMSPATREFYDLERFWRDAPAPGEIGKM